MFTMLYQVSTTHSTFWKLSAISIVSYSPIRKSCSKTMEWFICILYYIFKLLANSVTGVIDFFQNSRYCLLYSQKHTEKNFHYNISRCYLLNRILQYNYIFVI
jgi:hypothetical protein